MNSVKDPKRIKILIKDDIEDSCSLHIVIDEECMMHINRIQDINIIDTRKENL